MACVRVWACVVMRMFSGDCERYTSVCRCVQSDGSAHRRRAAPRKQRTSSQGHPSPLQPAAASASEDTASRGFAQPSRVRVRVSERLADSLERVSGRCSRRPGPRQRHSPPPGGCLQGQRSSLGSGGSGFWPPSLGKLPQAGRCCHRGAVRHASFLRDVSLALDRALCATLHSFAGFRMLFVLCVRLHKHDTQLYTRNADQMCLVHDLQGH